MYYLNEKGERVYTLKVREPRRPPPTALRHPVASEGNPRRGSEPSDSRASASLPSPRQKTAPDGSPTQSAHPARFSPDDKFSKQRVACKKRFGLLPTRSPSPSSERSLRDPSRGVYNAAASRGISQ